MYRYFSLSSGAKFGIFYNFCFSLGGCIVKPSSLMETMALHQFNSMDFIAYKFVQKLQD